MSDKAESSGECSKHAEAVLSIDQVVPGSRISRRGMNKRGVLNGHLQRERFDRLNVTAAQLACGPVSRCPGKRIEPAIIKKAGRGVVVVPCHRGHGHPLDLFKTGDGLSPIADHITETEDLFNSKTLKVRENGRERFPVSVDIRDEAVTDGSLGGRHAFAHAPSQFLQHAIEDTVEELA